MGLAQDIQAFADKALKAASDNTNKIVKDLDTLAVNLSPSPSNPGPYAIGLLVNNWVASVGTPDTSTTTATSTSGDASLASIESMLASNPFLGKDNVVYFTNSTEESYYADILGWARGKGNNGWNWSGNAGAYMMRAQAIQYIQQAYT